VGPVGEDEDLTGEACLDDAVGAGRGEAVGAAGCCAGEPQRRAVRAGKDLHVYAVLAVFHRVARLVRADPADGNQGAVGDDVAAFTEAGESFVKTGCPGGQAVAVETPNPAASWANVSFFRRWAV
jgi:hypothetical protein